MTPAAPTTIIEQPRQRKRTQDPARTVQLAPDPARPGLSALMFTKIPAVVAGPWVAHFAGRAGKLATACFDGTIPTRMLFAPDPLLAASLHWMFFPRGEHQRFHWHPGGRHLLVLGDTPLTIHHSTCAPGEDPEEHATITRVPAHTFAAIRFHAGVWHRFSSTGTSGSGVIAFSFHDTDDVVSTSASLMEELTTYRTEPTAGARS
jgi:hypothetical protein